MTLALAQSAKPRSDRPGYWEWSVWLDGPAEELDAVTRVDYRLHPTYPQSNRSSANRRAKFRITSYGWGEFMLFATVHRLDGSRERLEHWLQLRETPTESGGAVVKRVYLSYAAGDSARVPAAKSAMQAVGMEVVTSDDLQPGVPWQHALTETIGGADAVVVMAPETASRAVEADVAIARDLKRPVLPVQMGGRIGWLPSDLSDREALQVKDEDGLGLAIRFAELS